MGSRRPQYETGIQPLDRGLDGGIPAGSTVALLAAPTSQSELLLYHLAADRPTLYLTAQRSPDSVRKGFESTGAPLTNLAVRAIDSEYPLAEIAEYVQQLQSPTVVVIDPMDAIESQDAQSMRKFFLGLQERLAETESIAVVHCLDGVVAGPQRGLTTYMADIVFDLETFVDGERVTNRLSVPKFRGGPAMTETLSLELTERVGVAASEAE